MRVDVSAHPAEIPGLLNRFTAITGAAAWQKREADFARQKHDNPLIERYLDSHFPLERAMIFVRRYRANTGGRIPQIATTPGVDLGALYSFATLMARVFPKLTPSEQHVLKGRMVGAFNDNAGLSPLAFEMRTVAHLMAREFEVEFHDLCGGGGYDFLASNADIEFEVECKSIGVDLGHRVHLQRQYQLAPYILDAMKNAEKHGIVQLVVVTVPDRLHGKHEFMAAVAERIVQSLKKFRTVTDGEPCTVSYNEFPIAGSPFDCARPAGINEDDLREYCNRMIGDEIGNTIITCTPRQSAVVIAVRSIKPNETLKGVYRYLKEASRQLSGSRPGVICVQFRNMTSEELRDLAAIPAQSGEATGIQLMTAKFFDDTARDHVHTVAYVAPGRFVRHRSLTLDTEGMIQTTSFSEDAASYVFTNKKHPGVNDARFQVFT